MERGPKKSSRERNPIVTRARQKWTNHNAIAAWLGVTAVVVLVHVLVDGLTVEHILTGLVGGWLPMTAGVMVQFTIARRNWVKIEAFLDNPAATDATDNYGAAVLACRDFRLKIPAIALTTWSLGGLGAALAICFGMDAGFSAVDTALFFLACAAGGLAAFAAGAVAYKANFAPVLEALSQKNDARMADVPEEDEQQ